MNFLEPIRAEHPPGNKPIFEEWFYQNYEPGRLDLYELLPVWFTSFYVNNNYGNDSNANHELQKFIDSLDKSKKWFCVLQYDDGILNDISGLDIKVFGSGGGRIDFPIPLICHPHPYTFDVRRDTFASFVGSMTHPIRRKMVQNFRHRYKIPMKHLPIKDYCELMARSIFSLAPRGYGQSSFRICEALQFGSIPVYISDHWIVPGNIDFNEYGVLVHNDEIRNLDKILKGFTQEQIRSKQEAGREIYKRIYTFSGCRQLILDNL
jgi:hypothetical protein